MIYHFRDWTMVHPLREKPSFVIYWCWDERQRGSKRETVGEVSASSMTQTHGSVLLDVIGLCGSHVNSWLHVAHEYAPASCRPGLLLTKISVGPLFASGLPGKSLRGPTRLTFEEFHEAFGETKASKDLPRGNDGHSYRRHACVLQHVSFSVPRVRQINWTYAVRLRYHRFVRIEYFSTLQKLIKGIISILYLSLISVRAISKNANVSYKFRRLVSASLLRIINESVLS